MLPSLHTDGCHRTDALDVGFSAGVGTIDTQAKAYQSVINCAIRMHQAMENGSLSRRFLATLR
jgi:hypothetical protein